MATCLHGAPSMATIFRPAAVLLNQYAEYHRDRRNIATHLIGVPLIGVGIGVLLSKPALMLGGLALTPGWLVVALASLWFVTRGALLLGVATSLIFALVMLVAHRLPAADTLSWLGWGLGMFVLGWIIQFIGHYYEGKKPAFVDDVTGLLVGPMFVTLELLAPLGLFKDQLSAIERHAGPTHIRNLAHPA
jgi:uncharacterized membrane protein YGL010W